MPTSNGWNLKPSLMVGIIAAIFAGGVAWGIMGWRVEALEAKQKEQTKFISDSRDRLGKIETHSEYTRRSIAAIENVLKKLEKRTRKVGKE